MRKPAVTTRTTFQNGRIEELALAGDIEALSVIKRIKKLEATCSQNRRIRSILGNCNITGVIQINTIKLETYNVLIHTKKYRTGEQ